MQYVYNMLKNLPFFLVFSDLFDDRFQDINTVQVQLTPEI